MQVSKLMIKRSFFFLLFTFLFLTSLFGQIEVKMENLLEKNVMNWSTVIEFTLEAANLNNFSNLDDAVLYVQEKNWLPKSIQFDQPAKLNGIALLIMRAFDLKGGIFYTLTKSPHYAYRELVFLNIIQGRTDPHMLISGQDFLLIVSRVLSIVDDNSKNTEIEIWLEDKTKIIGKSESNSRNKNGNIFENEINPQRQSRERNQSRESIQSNETTVPQLGEPSLFQFALNQLPAIPIAGNNLKFEFGGDNWIAKVDGQNFMAGNCIIKETDNGYILTLTTTNVWTGAIEKVIDLLQRIGVPLGPAAGPLRATARIAGRFAKWIPLRGSNINLEALPTMWWKEKDLNSLDETK